MSFTEVTSSELLSASSVIGTDCVKENHAFLLCKSMQGPPSDCLKVGDQVTGCVLSVFKKINSSSKAEFDAYKQCMANNENKFHLCRAQQEAFKASWAAAQWDAPSSFFQHVRVFCCALFLQYSPHVNRTGDACARAVLQTTRVCVDNCKVVYFKITLLIFKILWPLNDMI